MCCYTDTEIYTDQALTFNICKMIMEKIIISLKKLKNINFCTHFLLYNLKCYKQYEILNSDSSTQKKKMLYLQYISLCKARVDSCYGTVLVYV